MNSSGSDILGTIGTGIALGAGAAIGSSIMESFSYDDGVVEIYFMDTMAKIGGYLSVDKMIFDGIS